MRVPFSPNLPWYFWHWSIHTVVITTYIGSDLVSFKKKGQEQNKVAIAEKSRAESYLNYKAPLIVGELKERGDGGPTGQWKGEISCYLPGPGWWDARAAYSTSAHLSAGDLLRLYLGDWRGSVLNLCLLSNYVMCYCFTTGPWWLHILLMNHGTRAPPKCWWKRCFHITALWKNLYCSACIYLEDGVHVNFLPLQRWILYFTLVVLLCSLE